ncbi:uncharacterized protein LOC134223601 [Armigeres subalbatus]|uniref:uncharacterized protein LOC134223601 n=1 Tax=Armigeres subalbatus TaxID=124917 RepID=UPI002ED50613
MRNLFSRHKRHTRPVLTGDLKIFRTTKRSYLKFIDVLKSELTEPDERYGSIRVTKRDNGITKVIIEDSDTNTKIGFIYRNRDLYFVGLVVGNTFYVDKEVYEKDHQRKLPTAWTNVIGVSEIEALSKPLQYREILPDRTNTWLQIGKIGHSLSQLAQIGDQKERMPIIKQHLAPFVVAFSEGIRFPVVAQLVQEAFRKIDGTVPLSTNIVDRLSLGHPSERTPDDVFTIYSLLLYWGKLSDRVSAFYADPPIQMPPLKEGLYTLNLEKNQLNTLLGVAVSNRVPKPTPTTTTVKPKKPKRPKRDLMSWFGHTNHPNPAQLAQQIDYVDFEGNVPPQVNTTAVTHSPDVIGALHLLTVAMMYLCGKKKSIPLDSAQDYRDPREALAVAVDISDRLGCSLKKAGLEEAIGFEKELELQRQIAKALVEGDDVERVLTKFIEQHLQGIGLVESLKKQIISALAIERGLAQEDEF